MTRARGGVVIRPARRADADAIARIYVETWRSTYAGILPDRLLVGLSRRGQALIWSQAVAHRGRADFVTVAHAPGAGVVGFGSGGLGHVAFAYHGPGHQDRGHGPGQGAYQGEVYTLYVLPDHQGRGIGRRLLAALGRELLAREIGSAFVWVLAANPARFFYEAMGARLIGEREEVLGGARVRELAYGWPDLRRAGPSAFAPGRPLSRR